MTDFEKLIIDKDPRSSKGIGGFVDRHSRGFYTGVPIFAAIVAATTILFIEKIGEGQWKLVQYLDNIVQNVFVGGLVAIALAWLSQREKRAANEDAQQKEIRAIEDNLALRRRLTDVAVSSWTAMLGDSARRDPGDELQEQARSLRDSADKLNSILAKWADSTADMEDVRSDLERLAAIVWKYMSGGNRGRRLEYLDRIDRVLPGVLSYEKDMTSTGEERLRAAGPAIAAARVNTNAAIVESTVVSRPENSTDKALATHEVTVRVQLAAATTSFEPLYLLFDCLQQRIDSMRTPTDVDEATQQMRAPLKALTHEIQLVADALSAVNVLVLGLSQSGPVVGVSH
jgi:hypothetical protein